MSDENCASVLILSTNHIACSSHLIKSDSVAADVYFALPAITCRSEFAARCYFTNPVRRHIRVGPIACVSMWFCGACSDFVSTFDVPLACCSKWVATLDGSPLQIMLIETPKPFGVAFFQMWVFTSKLLFAVI